MIRDTEDVVARVARALWELEFGTEGKWPINVENADDWYNQARAALEASDRQSLSDRIDVLEGLCAEMLTFAESGAPFSYPPGSLQKLREVSRD